MHILYLTDREIIIGLFIQVDAFQAAALDPSPRVGDLWPCRIARASTEDVRISIDP